MKPNFLWIKKPFFSLIICLPLLEASLPRVALTFGIRAHPGPVSVRVGAFECCYQAQISKHQRGTTMAVSDNTRATEQRRLEDFFQQMQNSMESFKEQMQHSMEDFRVQQGQEIERLKEFVTGLSMQVSQVANTYRGSGEVSSGNFNQSLSRVEFSKFWEEDVQGWIYKCEQFFEVDNIEEGMKVRVASIHLSEKALQWHQSFMRSRGGELWPQWEEYKTAILSRFGSKPFDDPLAELMKLR